MQLRSIALTALVALLVWYWLKSREVKELALRSAARYCRDLDLSLLDQTVALKSVRLARDSRGKYAIARTYNFDFSSNGEDRYQGSIVMLGRRSESIKLAPHRIDH